MFYSKKLLIFVTQSRKLVKCSLIWYKIPAINVIKNSSIVMVKRRLRNITFEW